jgi:phosphatidyl-myo-inositol dimannoside synthase
MALPDPRRFSTTRVQSVALVVTEIFPPNIGGSGELLHNVYRRVSGIPVTVLTDNRGLGASAYPSDSGLRVIREPMLARHWGLANPLGLQHHLRRASRLWRLTTGTPTIVHGCCLLPEGLDAWLAHLVGGAPYLCWAHGEELANASKSRELSLLLHRVQRGASALIANCGNTARFLGRLGARPELVDIVHPGVDAMRFRPDAVGAADLRRRFAGDDEILMLTVGRLQARKGHDLALRALSGLRDHTPSIRYVVAGDGADRPRLQTLAADLKVDDRVTFLGAVLADELPALYAAADFFVHPNRINDGDFEGFGIVFLEAAAAGLPVIGGQSGGVPEAVADNLTGHLVSGTSVDELKQAILALADSPERRRALGQAGRARVEREFSWDRAAAKVTEIHLRVAAQQMR